MNLSKNRRMSDLEKNGALVNNFNCFRASSPPLFLQIVLGKTQIRFKHSLQGIGHRTHCKQKRKQEHDLTHFVHYLSFGSVGSKVQFL